MLLSKIFHKMFKIYDKTFQLIFSNPLHQFNDVLILKLLAKWEIDPINLNEGAIKNLAQLFLNMIGIVTFYGGYYHSNYDLTFIKAIKRSHSEFEDILKKSWNFFDSFSNCGKSSDKEIDFLCLRPKLT
jgi:hypothetical protein